MHTNKSFESKYKIDVLTNVNEVNRDFNENTLQKMQNNFKIVVVVIKTNYF